MFRAVKMVLWGSGLIALLVPFSLGGCAAETEPAAGTGAGGSDVGGAGGDPVGGGGGVGATGGGGSSSGTGGGGGQVDCPADVICVTTFPFEHASTTTGAASDQLDSYSCAGATDESGPEVVYRVDLPEDGYLALELSEPLAPGVDIDVHLLQELDGATCLDRGHWRAGALLTAGRYWVTADTWVEAGPLEHDGPYTLTFGLTTVTALVAMGIDAGVADDALYAFDTAWAADEADHFGYGVTDFSLRSDQRRLWILDLAAGSLRHHLYVSHGEMSSDPNDSRWATSFSNVEGSHQSSLGVLQGAETYTGSFGYSMRMDGLEPGYNDNVRDRAIVVHPWDGSTDAYVSNSGECAPTWGCAGLDPAICTDAVDFLAFGGLLLFHYPDGDWSQHSAYLP